MQTVSCEMLSGESLLKMTIFGDVISTNVDELQKKVTEVLQGTSVSQGGWNQFVLNLTSARMIDSLGLNLILSIVKKMKINEANIKILIANSTVHRTFLATRMDKIAEIELVES